MTCPACLTAAQELSHEFRTDCQGCTARAIARGPDYYRCRKAGKLDALYFQALERVGLTHSEVKAAAESDVMNKGATA